MKKITIIICAFLFFSTNYKASAQDEAGMKAWMDYMTPGDVHKMMAEANGEWKEEITMWMAPGAPPSKSTGKAVNSMIMGGRYQQSTNTASFNGMPFEGMSLLGYDNAKKVFVNSWIDNMGTGMMYMEGTWDDKTKTITFKGRQVDPMSGKENDVKQVVKFIDKDTQVMEMFVMMDGKEFKTLEIKFTRT